MEKQIDLLNLVAQKDALTKELHSLVYGAIEVRENNQHQYLYVHYREDGIALTKYVGEYNTELVNVILNNTNKAKALKKTIKQIDKTLTAHGYTNHELTDKVALNVDFARKHLTDSIYQQAVLEGIATTYAATETIIEGGKVSNMTANDIIKVVNLKHAWEFMLNPAVITTPTNFALLCEINKLIEAGFYYHAGHLRSTPVSIGGTTWQPELPLPSVIQEQLTALLAAELDPLDKAIELLLFVMKKQIFLDGNKRTAVIFANHFLISHAQGLIVIPEAKVEVFKDLLLAYYEGKDTTAIKKFLKDFAYHKI